MMRVLVGWTCLHIFPFCETFPYFLINLFSSYSFVFIKCATIYSNYTNTYFHNNYSTGKTWVRIIYIYYVPQLSDLWFRSEAIDTTRRLPSCLHSRGVVQEIYNVNISPTYEDLVKGGEVGGSCEYTQSIFL